MREDTFFVPPVSKSRDLYIAGRLGRIIFVYYTHTVYIYLPIHTCVLYIYIILLSSLLYSK